MTEFEGSTLDTDNFVIPKRRIIQADNPEAHVYDNNDKKPKAQPPFDSVVIV
jgi:hypothetical protein